MLTAHYKANSVPFFQKRHKFKPCHEKKTRPLCDLCQSPDGIMTYCQCFSVRYFQYRRGMSLSCLRGFSRSLMQMALK